MLLAEPPAASSSLWKSTGNASEDTKGMANVALYLLLSESLVSLILVNKITFFSRIKPRFCLFVLIITLL